MEQDNGPIPLDGRLSPSPPPPGYILFPVCSSAALFSFCASSLSGPFLFSSPPLAQPRPACFCASLTECRPPSAPPHPSPSSSFFVADFPACCLCALVWAWVYWCACLPRPFCRSRRAPRGRLSKMFSISVSKLCRPKERDSLPSPSESGNERA